MRGQRFSTGETNGLMQVCQHAGSQVSKREAASGIHTHRQICARDHKRKRQKEGGKT